MTKPVKKTEVKLSQSIHPTSSAKLMKMQGIKPTKDPKHGGSRYVKS